MIQPVLCEICNKSNTIGLMNKDKQRCVSQCVRGRESVLLCLLVLDSVTSTPQWIRQTKPRTMMPRFISLKRVEHPSTHGQKYLIILL
jgi:hypothetical protein